VSRFGVMFFEDCTAAFANLRRAASDAASLHCIVWRDAAENPFMTTAGRAAAPLLPELPPRAADGPGQFALGDPQRLQRYLQDSGWRAIELTPLDVECTFPASELTAYIMRLGPVGRVLAQRDEATRARVMGLMQRAFEPYLHGTQVRFSAACWEVTARSSGHD
jgi:hypothetical protein